MNLNLLQNFSKQPASLLIKLLLRNLLTIDAQVSMENVMPVPGLAALQWNF